MTAHHPHPTRRRLTQMPAAVALAAGLLAVPGIPLIADAVLPQREWERRASEPALDIVTAEGRAVRVTVPDGWESQDRGDTAVLRSDGSTVRIKVYDRGDRDTRSLAERVMRSNRVTGISAAWDGGRVASPDGSLSGDTCTAVSRESAGACAFVSDRDVVVSVISLGDARHRPLPVGDVVDVLERSSR